MSKKVIITGGSRGIGAACAKTLSKEGWEVYITYNSSEEKANALKYDFGVNPIKCDVSDTESVKDMFKAVGSVDALICCAGIALEQKLFTDTREEEWDKLFDVNVKGAYRCCMEAVPKMVHEKAGSIILFSSVWGMVGASCEVAYSASKGAVISMAKALAKELGPSGIRVNCIAPGVIDTDMNSHLSAEDMEALKEETPLCAIGTPEDVAELAAFLVSDKSKFITGQIISPNGGFVI